jgi:hypothetical protein
VELLLSPAVATRGYDGVVDTVTTSAGKTNTDAFHMTLR